MAENSAYKLLKKHQIAVQDKMKDDLEWFATELSTEDFPVLNSDQANDITNPRAQLRDIDKAILMVKPLLNWVKLDSEGLDEFVKILKKKPVRCKVLIQMLDTSTAASQGDGTVADENGSTSSGRKRTVADDGKEEIEPKKPRYESPIEEENPGVVVSEPQRQERPWSGKLLIAADLEETPMYGDVQQKQMYREKTPGRPPKLGTPEYEKLMAFTSEVDVILHTVNDKEYQAAVTCMEPPDGFDTAIQNFPGPAMVVGMFADKKVALIKTKPGSKCREKIDKALMAFKNARYIISVGVCYAFNKHCYKLGDVLVSTKISDLADSKMTSRGTVENRGETINVEEFLSDTFCSDTMHNPEFKVTEERESEVYSGWFLSYPLVMEDMAARDKFHAAVPNAIGGEMEGGVLMQVRKEKNNNIQGIVIIKGVVDYADGHRWKNWQFTASLAAVHYTWSKLNVVHLPVQVSQASNPPTTSPPQATPTHEQVMVGAALPASQVTVSRVDPDSGENVTAHHLSGNEINKITVALMKVSNRWKDIGRCLGFTDSELANIEDQPTLRYTTDYLSRMLSDWGQWIPGDGRHSTCYANLKSIKDALKNIGLGVEAEELNI